MCTRPSGFLYTAATRHVSAITWQARDAGGLLTSTPWLSDMSIFDTRSSAVIGTARGTRFACAVFSICCTPQSEVTVRHARARSRIGASSGCSNVPPKPPQSCTPA